MKNKIFYVFMFSFLLFGCKPYSGVVWQEYQPELMSQAVQSGQPVVAYFYAAWCGPCHAMKEYTFSDPRVIEALSGFTRIKVDMSFIHSKKIVEIADRYHVESFPTVIFLDQKGDEVFRTRGFLSADALLNRLNQYRDKM